MSDQHPLDDSDAIKYINRKEFNQMSRQKLLLLSSIALFIFLCQNNFIGYVYGQTRTLNEPFDNSFTNEKIAVNDNKYTAEESKKLEQQPTHQQKSQLPPPEVVACIKS